MNRISKSDLENVVRAINEITGSPLEPYKGPGDEGYNPNECNPNGLCYHLDWAYGGCSLVRMCKHGTGINSIIPGFHPKRELYELMQSYKAGLLVNQ